MTGPREWRHAGDCAAGWAHTRTCWYPEIRCQDGSHPCSCGLSAVRDALDQGHRVVVGPDGVEGRLEGWPVSATSEWSTTRLVPIEEEPTEGADMSKPIVVLVKQEIVGGNWRHTLYRRQDGSEFHVTIPPYGLVDPMSKTQAGNVYDERAEADMMLRLAGGHR